MKVTDIWKLYEQGKNFLDAMDMVNRTTQAYRFYEGDHWHGLDSGGEKMPVIEIIKPVVDYKTTILTQNSVQAMYTSQNYETDDHERAYLGSICGHLNDNFLRFWENEAMDTALYDIVRDSMIAGDSYMYLYFEPSGSIRNGAETDGRVRTERIDNTNIMFADENEPDIQKQQHILVLFRRTVKSVREEAKRNGIKAEDIRRIVPDDDRDMKTGYTEEVKNDSKCLCIMKLWKENGSVHMAKSTKNVVYLKPVDLTIPSYPIASYVWEPKKGLCRGVSEVTKYIPNQIWVNRLEAYRLISAKMSAFPKLVYSDSIVNSDDIDAVGVAIAVQETDARSALQSVGYINPAPMSGDAKMVLDELMTYTKDAAGASDIATGREKSDNYSALLAVQQAAAAPLNRQSERMRRFVEDIARIVYDFWCCYYPMGLTVVDSADVPVVIPQEDLKKLKVQVRVDITPVSPLNKLTEQQKADNLLSAQQITFDEYVSILPDDEPMKAKLGVLAEERKEAALMQRQAMAADQQFMAADEAERAMSGFIESAIAEAAKKEVM